SFKEHHLLRSVIMANCDSISDISPFEDLNVLDMIHIYDCKMVSNEQIEQLRKKLLECNVRFTIDREYEEPVLSIIKVPDTNLPQNDEGKIIDEVKLAKQKVQELEAKVYKEDPALGVLEKMLKDAERLHKKEKYQLLQRKTVDYVNKILDDKEAMALYHKMRSAYQSIAGYESCKINFNNDFMRPVTLAFWRAYYSGTIGKEKATAMSNEELMATALSRAKKDMDNNLKKLSEARQDHQLPAYIEDFCRLRGESENEVGFLRLIVRSRTPQELSKARESLSHLQVKLYKSIESGRKDSEGIKEESKDEAELKVPSTLNSSNIISKKTKDKTKVPVFVNSPRYGTPVDPYSLSTKKSDTANSFSGQIVDTKGHPIEGVKVDAWTWYSGNEVFTDVKGRFILKGFDLDQKTAEICISKPGYTPRRTFRQPLGELLSPLILGNKTYLEGHVTNSKGQPVAHALIRADGGERRAEGVVISETVTEAKSDDNGRYRLYMQGDTYKITATAPEGIFQQENYVLTKDKAQRLDMTLTPGVTFKANLIDTLTHKPIEGVKLYNWRQKEITGVSDKNGFVAIKNMRPGVFEFNIDAKKQGYMRWWSADAAKSFQQLSLGEKDWDGNLKFQRNFGDLAFDIQSGMKPVTILFEKGVHISGRVIDPDGNPVAGATVAPANGKGNSLTGDTRFSYETDKQGIFKGYFPAGKEFQYNLIAHDGKYMEWRKWANGTIAPFKTMPGEEITDIVLHLQPPQTVTGIVLDHQGNPVANRRVRACRIQRDDNRYYVPTTRTNAQGEYTLKFVAPGKHFIQVHPFWGEPGMAPDDTTKTIEIIKGKPTPGVNFKLRDPSLPREPKIYLPKSTGNKGKKKASGLLNLTREILKNISEAKDSEPSLASLTVNDELKDPDKFISSSELLKRPQLSW
ncbi:MAG: carboxypeptidase regulatory-like domain-containing protein, partial [Phycisphaerae bacterium]|nr:carboxypeptidase regulatory-like domain-containing protein [Phycisphaerae bacterium]